MNKTANYKLNKPIMTDFVSESVEKVFGENFEIIDETIKEMADEIEGKADSTHTHSEYAPKASPTFTGTPKAPTASKGTNTTQLATTAFVKTAIDDIVIPEDTSALAHTHANKTVLDGISSNKVTAWDSKADGTHTHSEYAPKASPTFTGTPKAPTASKGTNTTQLATTAFVQEAIDDIVIPEDTSALAHTHTNKTVLDGITSNKVSAWDSKADGTHTHSEYAPKASPTFTGTPKAPTASKGTNTTQLATTAFVKAAIDDIVIPEDTSALAHTHTNKTVLDGITSDKVSAWDSKADGTHSHSDLAPKASPVFTGTPTADTAAKGTNTKQLATTAFVEQEISDFVPYKKLILSSSSPITLSDYTTPAVYWIDHNAGISNSSNSSYFTDLPSDILGDMSSRGLSNGNGIHLVVEKAVRSISQYIKQVLKIYCTTDYSGDYILAYTRLVSSTYIGSWKLMGDPVSITAAAGTSDKTVATTEFVATAIAALTATQIGAAAASHNHSASNITSGTLSVSRGGTGITSLTNTDYTTSRVRGIALQTTVPDSIPNGHIVGVYAT